MSTLHRLVAEIKRAVGPGDKDRVLKRISRDYGRGFAENIIGLVEADAHLRETQAADRAHSRQASRQ